MALHTSTIITPGRLTLLMRLMLCDKQFKNLWTEYQPLYECMNDSLYRGCRTRHVLALSIKKLSDFMISFYVSGMHELDETHAECDFCLTEITDHISHI